MASLPSVRLQSLLCLFFFFALRWAADAAPSVKVSHAPKQPKSAEAVTVTIDMPVLKETGEPLLEFQVVEPGEYIALNDPAYSKWSQMALKAAAGAADRSVFKAELPAELQKNRRLIRYRILLGKTVIAPSEDDSVHNFAYFVYDGIPSWRAAINPKGTGKEREATTFSPAVMGSVQAYHLISKQPSIENVTWRERVSFMQPGADQYKYTGTLVVDGIVYDHIRFRARGGAWRYAMGKNMWKIDFNKGHHLEARDNRGAKYPSKWGKLNLGACIQQGNYGLRGEHGMLEAVTFKLFNLAGVEAPQTHWIQLRIVDGAEENPASQYRGDFWGLYLAVENLDDDFLKDHGLPDGNLYKMEGTRPQPENIGKSGPTDRSDVLRFMRELQTNTEEKWWRSNVSLPRYYSYRSIVECVHHYDIGSGKNYFYFNNPDTKQWQVVPWDLDLTWADRMYGDGDEPFISSGLLQRQPFKSEYRARLAELRDLLFNPEQAGALIDEYATFISDPKGALSMVDADRAKWDYHPVMSSNLSVSSKSGPGLFYKGAPAQNFAGMLQIMKDYVEQRGRWIDRTLLAEPKFPAAPTLAPPKTGAQKMSVHLKSPASAPRVRWRLAEISDPKNPPLSDPRKYEIEALWEKEEGASMEFPTQELKSGHLYRIRSRIQDAGGEWGHWSAPVQFAIP